MAWFTLLRIFSWTVFVWLVWRALKYEKKETRNQLGAFALVLLPNEIWHYLGARINQPLQNYIGWSVRVVTVVALVWLIWLVLKKAEKPEKAEENIKK